METNAKEDNASDGNAKERSAEEGRTEEHSAGERSTEESIVERGPQSRAATWGPLRPARRTC